jgi:hypothetical protein
MPIELGAITCTITRPTQVGSGLTCKYKVAEFFIEDKHSSLFS